MFIKTQVLQVDELLSVDDVTRERQLLLARAFRGSARPVIQFLSQLEDFQRGLFERRKLVLQTDYCVTLDRIPGSLHAEVAGNGAQIEEWTVLYNLTELRKVGKGKKSPVDTAFLARHAKVLVVDTRHFPRAFKAALLASFEDLDSALDGVLIKADNIHALGLVAATYSQRIGLIYIDPPFNTETHQFLYKDRFKDATWLTMMQNRLDLAKPLLKVDGSIYVHLDLNSNYLARFLLDALFGAEQLINEIIWRIGWVSGYKVKGARFVRNHETIFAYGGTDPYFNKAAARIPVIRHPKGSTDAETSAIAKKWGIQRKYEALKLVFYGNDGVVHKSGIDDDAEVEETGYYMEDTWNSNEYERLDSNKIKRNAAEYTPNGSAITQKPEALLQRIISVSSRPGDYVMDFFGGAGTTPAVAKKMGRKFLAVESAPYFETDMLWRLKKVISGHRVGISAKQQYDGGGFFKYQVLETYEDILEKVDLTRETIGDQLAEELGDEYVATELLRFETGPIPGLSPAAFADPLNYKTRSAALGLAQDVAVDFVESFNYLLGLQVRTVRAVSNGDRDYVGVRGDRNGAQCAVVWRRTDGLSDEQNLKEDAAFIETVLLPALGATQAAQLFVNGPCIARAHTGAESLEAEFTRLVNAPLPNA